MSTSVAIAPVPATTTAIPAVSVVPGKRAPQWHAEAAATIQSNFSSIHTAFMEAARRAAWFGLFLIYVKARGKEDGSIPHGRFGPWCEKNTPGISAETRASYMAVGRGLIEQAKLPVSKFRLSEISHPGKLPKEIELIVAGKTQKQLFLEYKQGQIKDDCMVAKRGRLKGEGGASKAQREASQQAEESARLEALEIRTAEISDWLKQTADAKHIGLINETVLDTFCDSLEIALNYAALLRAQRRLAKRESQKQKEEA